MIFIICFSTAVANVSISVGCFVYECQNIVLLTPLAPVFLLLLILYRFCIWLESWLTKCQGFIQELTIILGTLSEQPFDITSDAFLAENFLPDISHCMSPLRITFMVLTYEHAKVYIYFAMVLHYTIPVVPLTKITSKPIKCIPMTPKILEWSHLFSTKWANSIILVSLTLYLTIILSHKYLALKLAISLSIYLDISHESWCGISDCLLPFEVIKLLNDILQGICAWYLLISYFVNWK